MLGSSWLQFLLHERKKKEAMGRVDLTCNRGEFDSMGDGFFFE